MRLPYAPSSPSPTALQSTRDTYSRIAARRFPRPLIPLDLALLHNPLIADGYNRLLGAIRNNTSLESGIFELAICRIAVLNEASYEWSSHAPLARKGGVKRDVLEKVLVLPQITWGNSSGGAEGEGGEVFSRKQYAVLAYTDAMTREVKVGDQTFEALKEWFDETQIVELTATIAGYNMVSRFLVALDVGENNGKEMVVPE